MIHQHLKGTKLGTAGHFGHDHSSSRGGDSFCAELISRRLWIPGKPLRLHLGCGEQHLDGYVNIDYPPAEHTVMVPRADIHADILSIDFPPDSIDEIRLHHVFEHFNRVTALALLVRWHTWLRIGGKLTIETPDLIGSARALLSSNASWSTKMGAVRHLAGDQAAHWGYHVDHWFPERFERTLRPLGFSDIQTVSNTWHHEPFLANVTVQAIKIREVSRAELLTAAEAILWESTVSPEEKPTFEVWKQQLHQILGAMAIPHAQRETRPGGGRSGNNYSGYCIEDTVADKVSAIQNQIEVAPQNSQLYLEAARLLLAGGRSDLAARYLDDASELDPATPGLAELLEGLG